MTSLSRLDKLPPFDEFVANTAITRNISDIHRFTYTLGYQKTGAISAPEAVNALVSEGYNVINDLLLTSGIHYLQQLEAKVSSDSSTPSDLNRDSSQPIIEFKFGHDTKHCSFQFTEDKFKIVRRSSSFEDFYGWYANFMPEAARVEMTLRSIIERASGRQLRPVQSIHDFVIDFSNFRKPSQVADRSGKTPPRNMNVLQGIIPQLPGSEQNMKALTEHDFYRLDLTLSKREVFPDAKSRNLWYVIEAPFNEKGRFIVFTAQFRNTAAEIIEDGDVVDVVGFDPEISGDYRLALVDFLRDRALEGFAKQLLKDWEFDTEREL